jgi:Gene product 88
VSTFLLTNGNSKLGNKVFSFNLPPVVSCPGLTPSCRSQCYARRGHWCWPSTQESLLRNWEATRKPFFAQYLIWEIRVRKVNLVRLHAAGDFFDTTYIKRWAKVIKASSDTKFWAYTRSWRVPQLRTALEQHLLPLSNIKLWYSSDSDSGVPDDVPKDASLAYMQQHRDEAVPDEADLVFRVCELRQEPAKRIGLTMVCPTEQGKQAPKTDCGRCGQCWSK